MALQNLNIDDLFFQKIKNNNATNFINSEDLDRQFSFVKTYINNILVPNINALTNGEIAEADDDNPINKFLFNDKDGLVKWSFIDSNLIPDNYLSYSTFAQGPEGSILRTDENGIFGFLTPNDANNILSTDEDFIKWRLIDDNVIKAGFDINNKITGDKFIKRTLKNEHLKPDTLTPNVPDLIARTSKIIDGAVTGPKILPNSLELDNFDVSASFPFERLYSLLNSDHFDDNAITSKITKDRSIKLEDFVNYKWQTRDPRYPPYFELQNYLNDNIIPAAFINRASNQFAEISRKGNAYFLFFTNIIINDPKNPVSYYWPKREFSTTKKTNGGITNLIGEFQVPNSIPEVVTLYKYKFVTMGKLKNNTITANNLFPEGNSEDPVRLKVKIFFAIIAPTTDSAPYYKYAIDQNPLDTLVIRGEQDRINYITLKNQQGFAFNVIEGQFPELFQTFVLSPGMCMDSTNWFGGNLLPNFSGYRSSGEVINGILRLQGIHLKNGTIGKRHFIPSELARMKAAADAKFNG